MVEMYQKERGSPAKIFHYRKDLQLRSISRTEETESDGGRGEILTDHQVKEKNDYDL